VTPRSQKIWGRVVTIATLASVELCGVFFEELKQWFPWLTELQMRSYNALSKLEARRPRSKWIVAVEIDDAAFYEQMKLGAGDRTDRTSLAKLIRIVADANAAVIALDIDLSQDSRESEKPREAANRELLNAIAQAVSRNIPVILTRGFDEQGQPLPNIYQDQELPHFAESAIVYRGRVGFDHAAEDIRKVPLVVEHTDSKGESREYSSFALETVDAFEEMTEIRRRTRERLGGPIAARQFVYTTFLPREEFSIVSAADLLQDESVEKKEAEMKRLEHRIALIGGNRHTRKGGGEQEWLDYHRLPPLEMTGMYFQANYIEGLLDDRIKSPVRWWIRSVLNLSAALLMIYYSGREKRLSIRMVKLSIFFIPVVLAYIASVSLGYVLDFVLPLLLLFLHAFIDHYIHLRKLAAGKELVGNVEA
jgi:CHASE2 domain-containing sensor protein